MTEMESRAERILIQTVQLGEGTGFLPANWHILTKVEVQELEYGEIIDANLQTVPFEGKEGIKQAKVGEENDKITFTIEMAEGFSIILHSILSAPKDFQKK